MDFIEQLEKLQELRDKQILTQTEFETEKKKLLEQMNKETFNSQNETVSNGNNKISKKDGTKLNKEISISLKSLIIILLVLILLIVGIVVIINNINNNKENPKDEGIEKNSVNEYVYENEIEEENITSNEVVSEEKEFKSIVFDYYSENSEVPNMANTVINGINVVAPAFFSLDDNEETNIKLNASTEYVQWAKSNDYDVWAMLSNNAMRDLTSNILNNYDSRLNLIEQISELATAYQVDGIIVDFEYMKETDKNVFSEFIEELSNRLKPKNMILAVNVTAVDAENEFSKCYDRQKLADSADYLILMGYDQSGLINQVEGTNAGADWIENNLKELIEEQNISSDKIILGIPFYTRLWRTDSNGQITNTVVYMNQIDEIIPSNATKIWADEVKQYFVEYEQDGATYKIWLEDEKSIEAKLELAIEYNLAGSSYWAKGFEKENVWNIIDETLDKE